MIRRVYGPDDLREIAERDQVPLDTVERDFLLLSIAGQLTEQLPDALCFKGGFVLRHVHGQNRLSKDIDATRVRPPHHKLDPSEVAQAIRQSARDLYNIRVRPPTTDTGISLDFDSIQYDGPLGGRGQVAVELSYREDVVLEPERAKIGPPYYDPFEIPVLQPPEIVAEKLRALAQRLRPTDLADLGFLLVTRGLDFDRDEMRRLTEAKFRIVRGGNVRERIRHNIEQLEGGYHAVTAALVLDAVDFETAAQSVVSRLNDWIP